MFATPREMYLEQTRNYRMDFDRRDQIEYMIETNKIDALNRIAKITDVFYVDAIALTIASGYEIELDSAIEIVNRLNLNDKHIAALLNDYEKMETALMEEALENEQYESLANLEQ